MSEPMVTKRAAEILRRARGRIGTPERWTQGCFAREGQWERGANPAAWDAGTCLCIDASVMLAMYTMQKADPSMPGHSQGAGLCLSIVARSRGYETASKFNDDPKTTHADVLAFLDETIALAVSLAGAAS